MQQEIAEVSRTEGNYAFLKITNKTSCGECSSKSSCGSLKLFDPLAFSVENKDKGTIKVENTLNLSAGDSVLLGLSPAKLIQGTLLVYIFPLLSLFVFATFGQIVAGEVASILAGLFGLVFSLVLVKSFVSKATIEQQFIPKMLKKSPTREEMIINMHNKSTPPPF